jgi:hypothetical protein
MNYAVGHNMPGYLPDDPESVYVTDSFEDAKRYLIHQLAWTENYAESEDIAEDFSAAQQDVNLWSSPCDIPIDNEVWWIQPTDELIADES